MKKAFTLAEVLITLAVIGVVAALTIPTLVQKYQKKELYTRFIKVYNALDNAMESAIVEEGDPSEWEYGDNTPESKKAFIDKYVAPYLKYRGYDTSYRTSSIPTKSLKGDVLGTAAQLIAAYSMPDYLFLTDGSAISMIEFITSYNKKATLFVDTNGEKGPNTVGRDMFLIQYGYDAANKQPLVGMNGYSESEYNQYCNPNQSATAPHIQGETCVKKLLEDGKMDY